MESNSRRLTLSAVLCLSCLASLTVADDSVGNLTIDSVFFTTTTPNISAKLEYRIFSAKENDEREDTQSDSEIKPNSDNTKKRENNSTTQIYIIAVIGVAPAAVAGLMWWLKGLKRRCIRGKAASKRPKRPTDGDAPNPFLINDVSIDQITYKIVERAEKLSESSAMWYNNYRPSSFVKSRRVYSLEVPRKNLDLIEVLGEGNFGQVWKAKAAQIGDKSTTIVAVKTNKINTSEKDAEDLLKELDIMLQLGTHPNVVRLLGCCTENEPYFLIMEYVSSGKLLSYLRSHRTDRTYYNSANNNVYNSKLDSAAKKSLSSSDLVLFAYQIAKGMEFISSHGIIHRDLAARNVLIDDSKTCKVADFGLSRSIRDRECDLYEQKTGGEMPIRWMSPESLSMGVFSTKSDVWAFGVLIWEIVTLGSTPYAGLGAQEVVRSVRDGHINERPQHCSDEIFALMRYCWAYTCEDRLSFTELRVRLSKLIELQRDYVDLDRFPDNVYYNLYASPGEKV